jgi:phage portal protein BeeE
MTIKNQIGKAIISGIAKAFNFNLTQLAQQWDSGGDLIDESASRPGNPYRQVSLVFTCINALIDGINSLPLVLSTIDEKIVESGPVYNLLFNNKQTFEAFITQTIGHYALERDVFWIFTDEQGLPVSGGVGLQVKNILVVPGSQMHPVTFTGSDRSELVGWEMWGLSGNRIRLDLSQVHQWKGFNPYNRFHGFGAITAAANDINYDFAASLHNASALANGAEPGPIITIPGIPDPDQAQAMLNKFETRHKGPGKAKRAALLFGGADIKTIAQSMADLEVAQITELSDKKICSAFGVPPGIAGLITEAQYSHGPAMRQFIFNTIISLAQVLAGHITIGIIMRFTASKVFDNNFPAIDRSESKFYSGRRRQPLQTNRFFRDARNRAVSVQNKVFAWFDSSQHPTVQEYQNEVAEKILKFTDAGIPLNSLIDAHDLPYEQTNGGKYAWRNMGEVPEDYILEAGVEGIASPPYPGPPPPEEQEPEPEPGKTYDDHLNQIDNELRTINNEQTKADDARRLRIWHNWKMSWAGIEREYKETMRAFFIHQQRVLLDKLKKVLNENKSAGSGERATRATNDEIIARIVFDLKVEDGKLRVINQTFFQKASELGIRQVFSEVLGLSGDKLAEKVTQAKLAPYLRGKLIVSTQKISGINKVTQRLVANQLKTGLDAGEGLNDLTNRVRDVLGGNRARALRIARTQTAGAVGSGRHTGMKSAGVELKTWLTAGDEEVRSAHKTAGEKYTDGITLDLPFIVANEPLMYPGDPSGSAGNIINCRCVELAKRATGKIFELEYYASRQFYTYFDMTHDKVT